ncbi:AzlD domain-containing protein [Microbacteriaceae bacterium VKM Ac-2854]|nr:AzlD domain-containing protein [Microbacteriaceae bacterium VKM Ac-2854]
MSAWAIVLTASIACLAIKVAGYLVPAGLMEKPTPSRVANLLTVALLSALIAVQTFAQGSALSIDARFPAVVVAAVLFAFRVPFILVVIVAALVAAGLRAWFGMA